MVFQQRFRVNQQQRTATQKILFRPKAKNGGVKKADDPKAIKNDLGVRVSLFLLICVPGWSPPLD